MPCAFISCSPVEYHAKYYQANKKKKREYYQANKERLKKYYQDNKEKIKQRRLLLKSKKKTATQDDI
jgi:hypothetical protein